MAKSKKDNGGGPTAAPGAAPAAPAAAPGAAPIRATGGAPAPLPGGLPINPAPSPGAARPGGPMPTPQQQAALQTVVGQCVLLMAASPGHKFVFLADIEWMLLPAILLQQYRIYHDDKGHPIAFAAWAFVSEEVEKRLNGGNARLQPADWKSGDRLWLIHIVAPLGHTALVLDGLINRQLSTHKINFHRHTPEGRMVADAVWGKDAPGAPPKPAAAPTPPAA